MRKIFFLDEWYPEMLIDTKIIWFYTVGLCFFGLCKRISENNRQSIPEIKDGIIHVIINMKHQCVKMFLKIITEESFKRWLFGRYYFAWVNVMIDYSITDKKIQKWMQIMCFIYSQKNSQFETTFIRLFFSLIYRCF